MMWGWVVKLLTRSFKISLILSIKGNYCILCIGIVWCIPKIDIISENKQKSLNTRISFNHIYFIDEFKLILYPQSRNSITHLTIRDIQDIGTLMCKIPT